MSSDEVKAAVGARDESDAEMEQLRAELAQPEREREVKQQRLAALEAEKKQRRLAQLKAVAEKRILGVKKAVGSLAELEDQDETKLLAAAKVYADAARTLDDRIAKRTLMVHEARLLAAAFGLPVPELPDAMVPARRDVVAEAVKIASEAQVAGTLYINPAPDHAELGDLPGRELLRQRLELEPPAPSPIKAALTLTPEDADVLATEAARIQRRKGPLA